MSSQQYEEWVAVFSSGTDYEADLVRDRLDDSGITAVVLTQRDHAFNLNVGDLAAVHVMTPPDQVEQAREVLQTVVSEEDLEEAAAQSNAAQTPAHSDREEAMLDSGNEEIHMEGPEDTDTEENQSS